MTPRHYAPLVLISLAATSLSLNTTSCTPSRKQQAEHVYSTAVEAFSQKKIGEAKTLLDSIHNHYADVPVVYREARELSKAVSRYENERTISFLDSMLFACDSEQQILLKLMVVDDPDAPCPRYISKTQQAYKTFNRSYLKASTDANGLFAIISVYTGEKAIHHDYFTLRSGDEFVTMPTATDGSSRNEFGDDEHVWETVRYSGQDAATAAKFVEAHHGDRISLELQGPKAHYVTYLLDADKDAIAHVWALSRSLRESRKIKSMIRASRLEMSKR